MFCTLIIISILKKLAKVLDAEIKNPKTTDPKEVANYDLVGFGAGIDSGKHYKELLDFADNLPEVNGKGGFIFSTSGVSNPKYQTKIHTQLREKLQAKGYQIVGEFNCHGFNTNSFLKAFGGMNKGRPNEQDLADAEAFAQNIKQTEK